MPFSTQLDRNTILDLVRRIRPRHAREYANANNWSRKQQDFGGLAVFDHTAQELTQLLIPIDADANDYPVRMLDVVQRIAEIEDRPILEVSNELLKMDEQEVVLSEPIREQWPLPQYVLDLQEDARKLEMHWHIFEVFGYDINAFKIEELDLLYRRYCHEDAHGSHPLNRISACRAFTWFVKSHGGPPEYGISPALFLDWSPTTKPFNS